MDTLVQYTLTNNVATLTLDDGKANVFSVEMIAAINKALDRAEQEAGAVVIGGRPGMMSAGFDLRVIQSDPEATRVMVGSGGDLLVRMFLFPLPVVIASTGHAIGAGALLLLAADHRLSTDDDCKIVLNEVSAGLPLPGFGVELARARISNTSLTQAVFFSNIYDPRAAREVGFIDEVVTSEKLQAVAQQTAEELAQLDRGVFSTVKRSFRGEIVEKIAVHPKIDINSVGG